MTPEQFETAADALQVCVADLIRDLLAAPEYAEFIDRSGKEFNDARVCVDVGMDLTVSAPDDLSDYAWQTGDNSYSGGAYAFPHWGVATLTRDSDADSIAAEIVSQIADAAYYAAVEE